MFANNNYFMKKLILLFSLILLCTVSCKQEDSNKPSGLYVEKAPMIGRTVMNFQEDNKVTISYSDGTSREFGFSVGEMAMTLTPIKSSFYPAQNLFYHYTDPNKFELGNIYDDQGEIMIFEKTGEAPKN